MPDATRSPRVLVTGSAKRIGRAIAYAFAQAGYSIVLHYNKSESEALELFHKLHELNGLEHRLYQCDLTESGAVEHLFDALSEDGKGLDVVVNNASSYRRCRVSSLDLAGLREDFRVNFEVPLEVMQSYRRHFHCGQIVNLLDYRVEMSDPSSGGYGFAKKSLKDATLACALEWAPAFRVNGVAPGLVMPGEGVPMERMERLLVNVPTRRRTTEDEVAKAVVFMTEMPCINGQILYVDGGLHLLGAEATGEKGCRQVP